MRTADVVIVGAGFAGAATAYFLARRGVRNVVLVEREKIPGKHASGRNAALAFTALEDAAEARLAREGLEFLRQPPAEFTDQELFRATGSLLVSSHPEGASAFRAKAEAARSLGLDARVLDAREIAEWVPLLRAHVPPVGLANRSDGVVDIHALLQGYLRGARACGVEVVFDEPVLSVVSEGGRVRGLRTRTRDYATPCVVNAAGAWAGEIAALAGAHGFHVEPRRRHLFLGQLDAEVPSGLPFVWHNDLDVYFRPEGGGLLMSPCDATPHPPVEPTTDEAAKFLLAEKMRRAFPSLAEARITTAWACLRTFAPDERFVIGEDPVLRGFFWVACLGGHGMTTSPAVGRLASEAVCAESAPLLAPFSPARFAARKAP